MYIVDFLLPAVYLLVLHDGHTVMCTVIRYGLGIDSVYEYSLLLLAVSMSISSSMQINSKSSQLEFKWTN